MSIASTSRGGAFHWNGPNPLGLIFCGGSRCAAVFDRIRQFHLSKGWRDVAYNHLRCPGCGRTFVGRDWGARSAANGTTAANREWHAWMVMYGGNEPLTESAKQWLHEMNAEHRRRYGRSRLTTHRAVRGGTTDCPGPEGLAWIASGAPLEDEMNSRQEATLDRVLEQLTNRTERGHLAREQDTVKQALGHFLASVGSGGERLLALDVPTADQIADAVVAKLPAGSVSPSDVAEAVADELKRRL